MMAAVESIPLRLAYLADPNSVHTRRWIGFFATRGHEVHLLVGTDDEVRPGLHDRVQVHRYRRFGRRRLPFISSLQGRRSLRGLLAKLGPDVLHAHFVSRYGWQAPVRVPPVRGDPLGLGPVCHASSIDAGAPLGPVDAAWR
jgi:hypothetical protein